MATPTPLIVFSAVFSLLAAASSISAPPSSFSLQGWNISNGASFDSVIALHGGAEVSAAEIKLPGTARLVFNKPLRFLGTKPGFSTNFTFSISGAGAGAPHGLAFWLSPSDAGGNTSILSFKFVAAASGDHIEIDAAARGVSIRSANLSGIDMGFSSGGKLLSWIDYDGESKRLEVRLTGYGAPRPSDSFISYPVDLSSLLWREAMFVGMSSWSEDPSSPASASSVYAWSFALSHGAPYLMHSEPLDPHSLLTKSIDSHRVYSKRVYPWRLLVALVFGAVCGFLVLYAGLLLRSALFDGRPVAPVEYPENAMDSGYEKVVLVGDKGVADKAQLVAA